jgi:hypothetical protein
MVNVELSCEIFIGEQIRLFSGYEYELQTYKSSIFSLIEFLRSGWCEQIRKGPAVLYAFKCLE